jgi:hypothetical protein
MKLLVAFQGMLTLQISGTNSGDGISFTELGGGAKITRIFKDKFALEMAKVDLDESELRREIAYAIRNLQVLCVCVCVCVWWWWWGEGAAAWLHCQQRGYVILREFVHAFCVWSLL